MSIAFVLGCVGLCNGLATPPQQEGASSDSARVRFSAAPEVGVLHSEFAGVPINAVDARLWLGVLHPKLAASGYVGYTVGRTEWGLATQAFFTGQSVTARLGRWQLGGGWRLGLLRFERFTSGPALVGLFLGLEPLLSFDVARLPRDRAIYLTAAPALDIVEQHVMWSAGLRLGLRL